MCTTTTRPLVIFDYADTTTWDSQTLNITSVDAIPEAIISDLTLDGYGLTAIDIGRVINDSARLIIDSATPRTMTLIRTSLGGVSEGTAVAVAVDVNAGTYIQTSGSNWLNFFKLEDYPYQLLPYRFQEGFTVSTALHFTTQDLAAMTDWNDGFFFFMGTRAEDKFLRLTSTVNLATSPKSEDIENNCIGLKVDSKGAIAFRYLNDDRIAVDTTTANGVIGVGWNVVTLTYQPCEELAGGQFNPVDEDVLRCAPRRLGNLALYVNGIQVLTRCDYPEFFFKGFSGDPNQQLGVPYNLGWGGGSPGLKNGVLLAGNELADGEVIPEYGYPVTLVGLPIEKNFSGNFTGGIQTLKLWETALNFLDIRSEFNASATKYGLQPIRGGRTTFVN